MAAPLPCSVVREHRAMSQQCGPEHPGLEQRSAVKLSASRHRLQSAAGKLLASATRCVLNGVCRTCTNRIESLVQLGTAVRRQAESGDTRQLCTCPSAPSASGRSPKRHRSCPSFRFRAPPERSSERVGRHRHDNRHCRGRLGGGLGCVWLRRREEKGGVK